MRLFPITKKQWANLLPAIPCKLWTLRATAYRPEYYYVCGTHDDYRDAMRRCALLD